jgi:peptidoglycan hydrolase-like protein with peptidoglycan-binding domain
MVEGAPASHDEGDVGMRASRRVTTVTVSALALAAVAGAAYGVWTVGTSTDSALRERSAPSPVAADPTPTVAGTQAVAPTPTVTPSPEPEPVLGPGDHGVDVRELQGRLSQLAWFTPPMSGDYDRATRAVVAGFQAKRSLDRTGVVDPQTWRRLVRMTRMPSDDEMFNRAGPALFERGDEGREVRQIQARLRQIAWFFGDVSDHYGDRTVEAVRGFQAKRRVPVTGKVDRRTLELLDGMTREPTRDELANRKPDPADGSALDPRCVTGRALCVDKSTNSLRWVVDGTVRMSVDVRFGSAELPTREGQFAVFSKSRDHVSSLYDTSMPYAMFFSGGQAVHYSPDFAANGYNGASHGCVNVRDLGAIQSLFEQVQLGDRVVVYRS